MFGVTGLSLFLYNCAMSEPKRNTRSNSNTSDNTTDIAAMLVKMNEASSTISDLLPKVETWATVFTAIGLLKVLASPVSNESRLCNSFHTPNHTTS